MRYHSVSSRVKLFWLFFFFIVLAAPRSGSGGGWGEGAGGWSARVTNVRDLTPPGFDTGAAGGRPALPLLPPGGGEMVTWDLALPGGEACVCTLRTSGTEPKVKFYVEVAGTPGQRAADVAAVSRAAARQLVDAMLTPEAHGLSLTGLDDDDESK